MKPDVTRDSEKLGLHLLLQALIATHPDHDALRDAFDRFAADVNVRAATERGPGVIDKAVIAGYRARITDAVPGDGDGAFWLP